MVKNFSQAYVSLTFKVLKHINAEKFNNVTMSNDIRSTSQRWYTFLRWE